MNSYVDYMKGIDDLYWCFKLNGYALSHFDVTYLSLMHAKNFACVHQFVASFSDCKVLYEADEYYYPNENIKFKERDNWCRITFQVKDS